MNKRNEGLNCVFILTGSVNWVDCSDNTTRFMNAHSNKRVVRNVWQQDSHYVTIAYFQFIPEVRGKSIGEFETLFIGISSAGCSTYLEFYYKIRLYQWQFEILLRKSLFEIYILNIMSTNFREFHIRRNSRNWIMGNKQSLYF